MAEVKLEGIEKQYPNGFKAVTDLNLDIVEGEFLVMVGPSGCGKSTTLRMIAGLEEISSGKLSIGDQVVNDLDPRDRDIAMVFQNYALYPHMTVRENIGFALKLARRPASEIVERVNDAARVLELGELMDRKPGELSGGQRQRVAMGRAIVRRPKVFLLDEPLSNLDAKLRVQMRAEITDLQREVGVTTFYVTHDQVEAMTMADRVAVINRGILQQVAPPQTLYDDPDNLFVAAFIGSPSMNLMEGVLSRDGDDFAVQLGSHRLTVPREAVAARPALEGHLDRTIVVGIRPKEIEDAAMVTEHPAGARMTVRIENVEALGFESIVHFEMDAVPVISEDALDLPEDMESTTLGGFDDVRRDHPTRAAARFSALSRVTKGDTVEAAVNTQRLHYFDLDSGLAIRD
ncbi:MAG: ABC transporter ATP-binding protein [Acidimicrobiales bacterium]|nr:MAG: ABC transporter ATP-binding protein [Acidimicrobiales bacterium]